MCLSPLILPNPWYAGVPGTKQYIEYIKRYRNEWFLHDVTSQTMKVPCGHCAECLQARQNEFVQRCYEMAKFNYVLFGTLTYNNESLPYRYVNGRKLKYADIRDFQNFIKRLRKYKVIPEFRYLCVTEYGDDKFDDKGVLIRKSKHRPHYHFLIFIPFQKHNGQIDEFLGYRFASDIENFIVSDIGWHRNYGDNKSPLYIALSNFIKEPYSYTYDCHFVTGETESVIYYVTKYVLKFSKYVQDLHNALKLNLPQSEFIDIWSLIRPKLLTSKGLGIQFYRNSGFPNKDFDADIDIDICENIEFSLFTEEVPSIAIDGKLVPLCKYYQDRCLTYEQRVKFHNKRYPEEGPFRDEFKDIDVSLDDYQNEYEKDLRKQSNFNYLQKRLQNQLY